MPRLIETCEYCGGAVRVIDCVEDATVSDKILARIDRRAAARSSA